MRHRRSEHTAERPTVGDECEAFLAGRIADLYEDAEQRPPCWAQINRLARGSQHQLTALAASSDPSRALGQPSWSYVLARLARQILELAADSDEELARIQQRVLWPLEDELVRADDGPVTSPGTLFHLVVSSLADAERHDEQGRVPSPEDGQDA